MGWATLDVAGTLYATAQLAIVPGTGGARFARSRDDPLDTIVTGRPVDGEARFQEDRARVAERQGLAPRSRYVGPRRRGGFVGLPT